MISSLFFATRQKQRNWGQRGNIFPPSLLVLCLVFVCVCVPSLCLSSSFSAVVSLVSFFFLHKYTLRHSTRSVGRNRCAVRQEKQQTSSPFLARSLALGVSSTSRFKARKNERGRGRRGHWRRERRGATMCTHTHTHTQVDRHCSRCSCCRCCSLRALSFQRTKTTSFFFFFSSSSSSSLEGTDTPLFISLFSLHVVWLFGSFGKQFSSCLLSSSSSSSSSFFFSVGRSVGRSFDEGGGETN